MAMIDRIKFESEDQDVIVWKYPHDDISYAGQLIVNEGQVALFFKNGQALDMFGPGRHTLKTGNIPLLENLVNLPFGGKTPFTAEVWYVRTNLIRDLKWGTPSPISVKDPEYEVTVPIRARGGLTIKINDPQIFVRELVGSQSLTSKEDIMGHMRMIIQSELRDFIAETVVKSKVSVIDAIETQISEISSAGKVMIQKDFEKIGIEVQDFKVEAITYDKNDPNVQVIMQSQQDLLKARVSKKTKLLDAEGEKAALEQLGVNYQQKRMMDIGMTAAGNEGQAASGMMGAGMGMGMGMGMGQMMNGMFQQPGMGGMMGGQQGMMGQQQGMQQQAPPAQDPNDPMVKIQKLKQMFEGGFLTQEEYDTKKKDILAAM